MSTSERFRRGWEAKFPEDVVPDELDFLKNPKDMNILESCLDRSVQKTDQLNAELEKQKFISEFILQLMDNRCGEEDQSDGGISVESASGQGRSLSSGDKPSDGVNSDVRSGSNNKHFREFDSSTFEMLDLDDEQRTYSFESQLPRKPKPFKGFLDRVKNTAVVRATSEPNIVESVNGKQGKPPRPLPRNNRGNDAIAGRPSFAGLCSGVLPEMARGLLSDIHSAKGVDNRANEPKYSDAGKQNSTIPDMYDTKEPRSLSLPVIETEVTATEKPTNEEADSSRSISVGDRLKPRRMDLYEEAIPVSRSRAADVGEQILSDEEHEEDNDPIYYSILLFKQQTLDQAKKVYFNDEPQSDKLERMARTLSLRYNNQANRRNVSGNKNEISNDQPVDHVALRHKRQSMINAFAEFPEGHSDSDELDGLVAPLCAEEDKLSMRRSVVVSILDSEQDYVDVLDSLLQYRQTFENLADTAQSVLSLADIKTIFLAIPDLHRIHYIFIKALRPKVEKWSNEQEVAEIFHQLAEEEYRIAPAYLKNYQKAISTVKRCYQENQSFLRLTKDIHVKGSDQVGSLEELLHKPVVRIQRNTLVLQDLINSTPPGHADYDLLQKTHKVAQKFLNDFESPKTKDTVDYQRYLVKHDIVVERVGVTRKLRHIFLFNDIFVCAGQKISTKQPLSFEAEWFIPLTDLSISTPAAEESDESKKADVESLRRKVINLQNDLKVEMKRAKASSKLERHWSFRTHTKNAEKIKKKLLEQKGQLILESPNLPFIVSNYKYKRSYCLLLSSDYERTSWNSAIQGLLSKEVKPPGNLSTQDLNSMLNIIRLPRMSALGSLLGQDEFNLEEEYLFGGLTITIRNLEGLKQPSDTYCCIEVDSFGHFLMQAKTKVISNSCEPIWDEDFDIDLEGAQTLRVLCYTIENGQSHLIGKNAYELSINYLTRDGMEEKILINEMSLSLFIMYRSREQTLKRTLSSAKEGLFGVRIRSVTRREGSRIPLIVTACVEDIESRGMRDVGIYRVSGLSSEVQRLKKSFEKNSRAATSLLKSADVNVVTGLLKLYLRELPEALFTDAMYPEFIKGMGLSDPEAKEKYMLNVIRKLPEPNYTTAIHIMDHLIRVSTFKDENKMTLQNLATVFGPTLLRPAIKEGDKKTAADMFAAGTREALTQVAILQHLLSVRAKTKTALSSHS